MGLLDWDWVSLGEDKCKDIGEVYIVLYIHMKPSLEKNIYVTFSFFQFNENLRFENFCALCLLEFSGIPK